MRLGHGEICLRIYEISVLVEDGGLTLKLWNSELKISSGSELIPF